MTTTVVLAESFIVTVTQQLVAALGLALVIGNAWALIRSHQRRTAYEAELEAWQTQKKGARGKRPPEPELAKAAPAALNIVIGLGITVVAVASLTFNWIG